MGNTDNNLAILIDEIPKIESLFHVVDKNYIRPAFNKPSTPFKCKVIHDVPEYIKWKTDIEYELEYFPNKEFASDIKGLFKNIDHSFLGEDDSFAQLKAKLMTLREHLTDAPAMDAFEKKLCQNILKALIAVQKNPIYYGKTEDEINDGLRDLLNMAGYDIKDQTRQGVSENGKAAGEVDLLVNESGMPKAIIEALKLTSLEKDNLNRHLKKALQKYDPVGCPYVFLFTYFTEKTFDTFWNKFVSYVGDYNFPYERISDFIAIDTEYAESRHGMLILKRSEKMIHLHLYGIHVA